MNLPQTSDGRGPDAKLYERTLSPDFFINGENGYAPANGRPHGFTSGIRETKALITTWPEFSRRERCRLSAHGHIWIGPRHGQS